MDELTPEFRAKILSYFGINEAVRSDQSFEALRRELEAALNGWAERPGERMLVMWTFSDRLIAVSWRPRGMSEEEWRDGEMRRHIWEIPWQRGETVTFGRPIEVKEIELYEPLAESQSKGKGQRLTETIEQTLTLPEAQSGARRIKAVGITADVVNGNSRRYPRPVLAAAVAELNSHLHESNGQGKLIATGEAEHPSDKSGRPNLLETVVAWSAASLDSTGKVRLDGAIVGTHKGKDILALIEAGVPVGVSMRGYGMFDLVEEAGQTIQQVTELRITGFDLVAQPSDPNGRVEESQQEPVKESKKAMNLEELLKLIEDKPELREGLLKQLGLTDASQLAETVGAKSPDAIQRRIAELQKAAQELEERKRQDAIQKTITEATADLPYGESVNRVFVESVHAMGLQSAEAVGKAVEQKRKEYDAIYSKEVLEAMGFKKDKAQNRGNGGPFVERMVGVFESQTGVPEFAKAAWMLHESMIETGQAKRRDWSKVETPAEIYARQVLKKFDETYKSQLAAEVRLFDEANTTSDLNLPYTVMRAIIEEAFPELIAANVFDFGTMQNSPERLYFERHMGESGAVVTVTDEDVTGDHDAWVELDGKRVRPGSVVLTNSGGGTTYVEGVDYVLDYAEGQLMTLSTGGTTDSQALKIDYVYDAIRKGEMQGIERAKNQLDFITINAFADRLAVQVSGEAIVFSRSQLGYDVVGRTLSNLTRDIRRRIDANILYNALTASLRQANNSGGTWTSASDPVTKFVEQLGMAKVKVYNRFYVPTSIVMSQTNADRLSNWDGFKRDGFPNAVLNAAGFAGSVKGLPIFATPEFSDSYALVTNRELVMHRVYQPLMLKGPFPSFDGNGKLIAADQYYVEEYNATSTPVIEKAAHTIIV